MFLQGRGLACCLRYAPAKLVMIAGRHLAAFGRCWTLEWHLAACGRFGALHRHLAACGRMGTQDRHLATDGPWIATWRPAAA